MSYFQKFRRLDFLAVAPGKTGSRLRPDAMAWRAEVGHRIQTSGVGNPKAGETATSALPDYT